MERLPNTVVIECGPRLGALHILVTRGGEASSVSWAAAPAAQYRRSTWGEPIADPPPKARPRALW